MAEHDSNLPPRHVLNYARAADSARQLPALVIAASFNTGTEAQLARVRLEAEGIPAFLDNENIVNANWFLNIATGGVRLMVNDVDLERSQSLLSTPPPMDQIDYRLSPSALPDEVDDNDGYVEEEWRCPRCHRKDVQLVPLSNTAIILTLLLLGLPLAFLPRDKFCRACGHRWRKSDDQT